MNVNKNQTWQNEFCGLAQHKKCAKIALTLAPDNYNNNKLVFINNNF